VGSARVGWVYVGSSVVLRLGKELARHEVGAMHFDSDIGGGLGAFWRRVWIGLMIMAYEHSKFHNVWGVSLMQTFPSQRSSARMCTSVWANQGF